MAADEFVVQKFSEKQSNINSSNEFWQQKRQLFPTLMLPWVCCLLIFTIMVDTYHTPTTLRKYYKHRDARILWHARHAMLSSSLLLLQIIFWKKGSMYFFHIFWVQKSYFQFSSKYARLEGRRFRIQHGATPLKKYKNNETIHLSIKPFPKRPLHFIQQPLIHK